MRDLFKTLKEEQLNNKHKEELIKFSKVLNKLSSLGMLDKDNDKSRITMHRLVQAEMRSFIRNNPNDLQHIQKLRK